MQFLWIADIVVYATHVLKAYGITVKNVISVERYKILIQPIKEVLQIVKENKNYRVVSATLIMSNENLEQIIRETNMTENVENVNNIIELTVKDNNN
jgi:hypothetical protein